MFIHQKKEIAHVSILPRDVTAWIFRLLDRHNTLSLLLGTQCLLLSLVREAASIGAVRHVLQPAEPNSVK